MSRFESWRRELDNDPAEQHARVNLAAFVAATFDGAIGDEPTSALETMEGARDAVVKGFAARVKRPLTVGELANVSVAVIAEWTRRRQARRRSHQATMCNRCRTAGVTLVEVSLPSSSNFVCGRCAVSLAVEAHLSGRGAIILPYIVVMENSFTTGEGRYFASGDEALRQQRAYVERRQRFAARVRQIAARDIARHAQAGEGAACPSSAA